MRVSDPGEKCRWQIDRTPSIYITKGRSLRLFRTWKLEARSWKRESKETKGPFASRLVGANLHLRDYRPGEADPKLRSEAERPRRAASERSGNRRSRTADNLGRL